jgi:hypothetical protein
VTTPTPTPVWSQGSPGLTAEQVVAEFARQGFAKPRQTTPIRDNRFRMVDGVSIYRVALESNVWRIYREETARQPRAVETI